ncbi:Heavy metal-associated isoprenylated plant protein [Quillaja saponaria]|uniref:Heavy metal-associated isoprenylated plant protein n=1 Tax=Quillaja saponaria TaxID=32244 RepID=A0AAD7P969_QUISA|nr:Heavy metal-associated isoprenylated plant protein [Quillaja saponaria]
MTIVEMSVHMDCAGCESKIKKALRKLDGVDDVDIDISMQKVTVMGWAGQEKVLKAVRKTGRRAELWPYPYNPEYHGFKRSYNINYQNNHQQDPSQFSVTANYAYSLPSSHYNYRKHGYDNGEDYGYYQKPVYSTLVNEKAIAMFSDENPHACAIM